MLVENRKKIKQYCWLQSSNENQSVMQEIPWVKFCEETVEMNRTVVKFDDIVNTFDEILDNFGSGEVWLTLRNWEITLYIRIKAQKEEWMRVSLWYEEQKSPQAVKWYYKEKNCTANCPKRKLLNNPVIEVRKQRKESFLKATPA